MKKVTLSIETAEYEFHVVNFNTGEVDVVELKIPIKSLDYTRKSLGASYVKQLSELETEKLSIPVDEFVKLRDAEEGEPHVYRKLNLNRINGRSYNHLDRTIREVTILTNENKDSRIHVIDSIEPVVLEKKASLTNFYLSSGGDKASEDD